MAEDMPEQMTVYDLGAIQILGIFASIAAVLAATYYCLPRQEEKQTENSENSLKRKISEDFTSCQSPDCVRCQTYRHFLANASTRVAELKGEGKDLGHIQRVLKAVGEKRVSPPLPQQQPNVLYFPGLTAEAWWNKGKKSHFKSEVKTLEDNKNNIFSEYKKVSLFMSEKNNRWHANNTPAGCWNTFYLYNQGVKNEDNCRLCPETTAAIESCPAFMKSSVFGNALFSVLHPQTEITEHFGPCNVRIRCHLGLQTPEGCVLKVNAEGRNWLEGECLLFDDSFKHSAHHKGQSSEHRVILLVDFWHPGVKDKEREALNFIFPTGYRDNS